MLFVISQAKVMQGDDVFEAESCPQICFIAHAQIGVGGLRRLEALQTSHAAFDRSVVLVEEKVRISTSPQKLLVDRDVVVPVAVLLSLRGGTLSSPGTPDALFLSRLSFFHNSFIALC